MYTLPKPSNSGHLSDFDRHLMVLLYRLGFGAGAICSVAECNKTTVRRMKSMLSQDKGEYFKIWAKMELEGNRRWYTNLITPDVQERIDRLHPYARPKLSWEI